MNFGEALISLREGKSLARKGWNGKSQYVYYVPKGLYRPCTNVAKELVNNDGLVPYNPYFALKTANDDISIWTPTIADCLAEDWYIV